MELVSSMNPALTAAFLMKNLCSSEYNAGTVITHLIFAGINFPTYSFNLCIAFYEMYLKVSEIISIKGNYLPSTETAYYFNYINAILYFYLNKNF